MLRYLSRRLLFIALAGVAIIFLVHLGMSMLDNSEIQTPTYELLTPGHRAWESTRSFIWNALQGDLGTLHTQYASTPVGQILRESYTNSAGLLAVTLAAASLLGLTLGTIAALSERQRVVLPILAFTLVGISAPSFFAALLLRQGNQIYLDTFGRHLVVMGGFGWDYRHLLLPALVLGARPLAYLTRASYLALNRVMESDYIRTAWAKGLSQVRTVNFHALPNVAVPVLTAVGVSLRFSLSTLPVVEFFFNWPGIGLRLLQAISNGETTVAVALAAALGLSFLLLNLFLDILFWLVDPRIRERTA